MMTATMTAIEMLQVAGFVLATLFARAALVVAVILVLAAPMVLFAYTVRAVEGFWHRHHALSHARHHA